jgi:D-alanyl-D-alanine carboxypeptidase
MGARLFLGVGRPTFAIARRSHRAGETVKRQGAGLGEGTRMMLRRAGLGLLVGAILSAPSAATAGPALVFEPYNGTVFYAEDPDAMWFPASLTKLMTAYVAFQAIRDGTVSPDTKLICSKLATQQAPSKLWLKEGESITLDVGLKVLIVRSANDVAVMIAEAVAGNQDAFVAKMNEAAQHLGMTRTHFINVNGLPAEGQYTTARDLARLARAIIVEFPDHLNLFTTTQIQVGKQVIRTHNGLLVSLPGADGMKTGFICESGFNIVASATRDGRKLVAVVLGEQSPATRRVRATDLLENGFKRYFWKSLFGTSLDGLAIQASLSDTPAHIADTICGAKVAKSSRKKYGTGSKSKPTLDLDAEEAVEASTDAAAAVAKGAVNATTGAAAAVAKGAVKATKKTLRKTKTVKTGAN